MDASRFDVPQQRKRVLVLASLWGLPRAPTPPAVVYTTAGEALQPFNSFEGRAEPSLVLTEKAVAGHAKYKATAGGRPRHVMVDRPTRTVTPGNLRAHGKDAMRVLDADGQQRTLAIPEAAALQSFPSYFSFAKVSDSKARHLLAMPTPQCSASICPNIGDVFMLWVPAFIHAAIHFYVHIRPLGPNPHWMNP